MITRRTAALAATGALFAPAVVRAQSLMRLRGIVMPPVEPVYYGFLDRLRQHAGGVIAALRGELEAAVGQMAGVRSA